jgi:NAD+ diphosphatase
MNRNLWRALASRIHIIKDSGSMPSLSKTFTPLIDPPGRDAESAWWFVFQNQQLLIEQSAECASVPQSVRLEELGLQAIRVHAFGLLGNTLCYAAECAEGINAPAGLRWTGLRGLLGVIDDAFLALAGRALQIIEWDRNHQFCGRCGAPTQIKPGERNRVCPVCGQAHYPRVAPVAMALIRRGTEVLLARSPHFPQGMYSALAGFVEPGETVEECLHREVREEVGVDVKNLRYFASQSWPFPHSLMLAFHADYAGGSLVCDAIEIEAAKWFSPANLPRLPHKFSIARRLIEAALLEIQTTPS